MLLSSGIVHFRGGAGWNNRMSTGEKKDPTSRQYQKVSNLTWSIITGGAGEIKVRQHDKIRCSELSGMSDGCLSIIDDVSLYHVQRTDGSIIFCSPMNGSLKCLFWFIFCFKEKILRSSENSPSHHIQKTHRATRKLYVAWYYNSLTGRSTDKVLSVCCVHAVHVSTLTCRSTG